jgi:PKD repeat protein
MAESGCSYTVSRQIEVLSAPIAQFAAEPTAGAYPLEVRFENSSSGATKYFWKFNDGDTSTETSPVHVFAEQGSYDVELTALDDQQCDDVFVASIMTVAPLPDVDVEMITLIPNDDGSAKLIVTLNNRGNTVLKDLPLVLELGGLHLSAIVSEPVAPKTKYNFVFSTAINIPAALGYICVFADLANDLTPEGNRRCEDLQNKLLLLPVFPNPVVGTMNVELIASQAGSLRISIADVVGRIVLDVHVAAVKGLNRHTVDVDSLQKGIYYLIVRQGSATTVQRIAVSDRR